MGEPYSGQAEVATRAEQARDLLVGRQRELDELKRGLERARSGEGTTHMVVGEPGVGKTRLVREVADQARSEGFLVVWGRCWESGGAPPFWPWIQILRGIHSELGTEALAAYMGMGAPYLAQLVPEFGRLLTDTAPVLRGTERDRFVMFDAAATFFKNLCREHTILLVFDDLHAADESTLHLMRFLARESDRCRLMMIGTYIETEVNSDPTLNRLLQGMVREGRTIRLGGLDREEVAQLCEQVAGDPAPPSLVDAVHSATEGNPFFVDEAMRSLASRGDLRRPDHSLGFRVPTGARGVLDRRLAPLSDEVIWVLSIASVIGREFESATLKEVADLEMPALLDILQRAVEAAVISEVGAQGRYSFRHILLRETLYEELSAADRMRLHNEVAQVIEDRYSNDLESRLPELAHHHFKAAQAGDQRKAVDYCLRAAKSARASMAYEEASRLYRRALRVAELIGLGKQKREEIATALRETEAGLAEAADEPAALLGETRGLFARQGEYWEIEFEGRKFRLRDSKGLRYLSQLLRNPGRELHSLDVVALVQGAPAGGTVSAREIDPSLGSGGLGDAGEFLDATAKAQYKRRMKELSEDLDEAPSFNDPERAARAQEELDFLLEQLSGGVGLGGRDRKAASATERARLSVTKAIKTTLSKIQENHPALGHHLAATVKTGVYCSYTPDPRAPIFWQF